jgi:hypothetical protein
MVTWMWELEVAQNDKSMFGCLNPACQRSLQLTFENSFFLLIGYCFKTFSVSVLSICLAVHTTRFVVHH